MKQIIVLLALATLLTSCFGGWDKTDDGWVVVPEVVVEENVDWVDQDSDVGWDIAISGDEDAKDDADLWVDTDPVVEDVATPEEKQVEAEVLNEFESDLEDIFSDLGV